jgi:hypothetical protein
MLTDDEKQLLSRLRDAERDREEALRKQKLADEEALRLKEVDEIERLRRKLMDGTITEEELRRLRELEAKYGLEPMEVPIEDMNLSKISDQDNFQELPPV